MDLLKMYLTEGIRDTVALVRSYELIRILSRFLAIRSSPWMSYLV
jgi:hypothetical protein